MSNTDSNLNDAEIKTGTFHTNIGIQFKDKVDNDKIVISNKNSYDKKSFKYFIDNKNDIIKPLRMMLPKMKEYVKCFDKTHFISDQR